MLFLGAPPGGIVAPQTGWRWPISRCQRGHGTRTRTHARTHTLYKVCMFECMFSYRWIQPSSPGDATKVKRYRLRFFKGFRWLHAQLFPPVEELESRVSPFASGWMETRVMLKADYRCHLLEKRLFIKLMHPPPRARARARPPGSEASWTHLKRQLEIRLIPFAQLILVYLRYTFLNKVIIFIIFMSASRLCWYQTWIHRKWRHGWPPGGAFPPRINLFLLRQPELFPASLQFWYLRGSSGNTPTWLSFK